MSETIENLSLSDKAMAKHLLFLRQKAILDSFFERGAISKQQYNNSLREMAEKMGFENELKDHSSVES